MQAHTSDQEKQLQASPVRSTAAIVLRYALLQILGGIAQGFVVGVVFYGILRMPTPLATRTVLAVFLMFAIFWHQAKRHPAGYWTHGPLVALCAGLTNLVFASFSGPLSASTLILGSAAALATSFISMAVAGRMVLGRSKEAGGVGA